MTNTQTSGARHIDALLGTVPAWHSYYGKTNTLSYSFSVSAGTQLGVRNLTQLSEAQQGHIRTALAELGAVTGIRFVEASSGSAAVLHFSGRDLAAGVSSLTQTEERYSVDPNSLYVRELHGYVYFDDAAINLAPGGSGFQLLLQELGHLFGLKHPDEDSINLATALDTTDNTLMSHNHTGPYFTEYRAFDLAALAWLYGGDGLGGAYGLGSPGGARLVFGSASADTLSGSAANDVFWTDLGNDVVSGGAGTDTAVFECAFQDATVTRVSSYIVVDTPEGSDSFVNVEQFRFTNGTLSQAELQGTTVRGSSGADFLAAPKGHTRIEGGAGLDTVRFDGQASDFVVKPVAGGWTVSDSVGVGGIDRLFGVERIEFADGALALDIDGHAGKVFRLYRAAFGRDADLDGLGFWIHSLDSGVSLLEMAKGFMAGAEFRAKYGASTTTVDFVSSLYENILGRAGEKAGIDYWADVIDRHGASRAQVLADFSEQPEHVARVIGTIQDGIAYNVWG
jgi:hypothetical protein